MAAKLGVVKKRKVTSGEKHSEALKSKRSRSDAVETRKKMDHAESSCHEKSLCSTEVQPSEQKSYNDADSDAKISGLQTLFANYDNSSNSGTENE